MERDFIWFNPNIGTPLISIAGYGIMFSRSAVKTMRTPAYVKLGYDNENKRIGIMVCGKEDKNKIEFASKEKNGNVRINSRDFMRMIESNFPGVLPKGNIAVRFTGVWDEEEGIMFIDLKAPIESINDDEEEETM